MQLLNVRSKPKDKGFTLLEITVVIVIVAILGAIVTPSFINLFNVNKVNDAVDKTKAAIQEAQNQAIRYSRKCQIKILNTGQATKSGVIAKHPTIEALPTTSPPPTGAPVEESCLLNGDRILSGIELQNESGSFTDLVISFDSKGRTDVSSSQTLFLSIPGVPNPKKCVVVSYGLGLIRSGDYKEVLPFASGNCETSR
jgi:prepilin-type N-terminal cleavage/methylation domain-containing protein